MKTILSMLLFCTVLAACKKDRSCSCDVATTKTTTYYNQNGSVNRTISSDGEYKAYHTLQDAGRRQLRDDTKCKSRIEERESDSYYYTQDSSGFYFPKRTHSVIVEKHSCEIK